MQTDAQRRAIAALLADPKLTRVLDALDAKGEETRIVGGAVRNTLMGLPVHDIDLATTAEPGTTVSRARGARLTTVPTGIAHGTVTVITDGTPFEVTTLRRDVTTDGRHAVVAFGRDFAEDAQRRDFTMNALSISRDREVHDPVGGLPDLEARRVRFIGDAKQRIAEDYLRILRLFRFHAAYGEGALDSDARDAAVAGRGGLAQLSAERLQAELSKLLVARRAAEVVTEMADTGLLGLVIGGVACAARFTRLVALTKDEPPDVVCRLGALAVATQEDAARLRQRLRLSNAATKRLSETATLREKDHGRDAPTDAEVDAQLLVADSRGAVVDALLIRHAASAAALDDAVWRRAQARARESTMPQMPVSGDDLLARGVPAGKSVGAALKTLQAKWIRTGFPRDPATVGRLIDEVLRDQS